MSYYSTILADSPQAYYRLDETSGLVANDSSGNGHNATLPASGITYSQTGALVGDADTSMLFTSTAALSLPYSLNPSTWTALSLEFWTKLSSGWQHIVVTTSNSTGTTTIYLNGSVYSSGSGDFVGIDTDIYFAGSPLSGNLDEISLYNYALTSTQVSNHYTAGTTSSPSRTIPASMALLSTLNRSIPAHMALLNTLSRTIPAVAALQATNTRTIPAAFALTGSSRGIPASMALMATISRSIPSQFALTNTSSRTVPDVMALMATLSRSIPAHIALMNTVSRTIPA